MLKPWIHLACTLALSLSCMLAAQQEQKAGGPAFDHAYQFQYFKDGKPIGGEKFQLQEVTGEGQKQIVLKAELQLGDDASFQKGDSKLVMAADGKPLSYTRSLQVQLPNLGPRNGLYVMEFKFDDAGVTANVHKDGQTLLANFAVKLEPGTPILDNNALSLFTVLCRQHMKEAVKEKIFTVFHAATLKIMKLKFVQAAEAKETVKIGDKTYETTKYDVYLDHFSIGFFYINADGLLIRDFEPRQNLSIDFVE